MFRNRVEDVMTNEGDQMAMHNNSSNNVDGMTSAGREVMNATPLSVTSTVNTSAASIASEAYREVRATEGDDATEGQQEIRELVKQVAKDKGKALRLVKLLVVGTIPLVSLITLSCITLVQIVDQFTDTKKASDFTKNFVQLDKLVAMLQLERGISTVYLGSLGENQDALYEMWGIHVETDRLIQRADAWPSGLVYDNNVIGSKEEFLDVLAFIRRKVTVVELTFDECIKIYTNLTGQLMNIATDDILIAGSLWPYLVAGSAMLRASDAMGIQRALGSTFFLLCGFSGDNYALFSHLDGEANEERSMAFVYRPNIKYEWEQRLNEALSSELVQQMAYILSTTYTSQCESFTEQEKFENSLHWFANMTTYIDLWKEVREDLLSDTHRALNVEWAAKQRDVIIYPILIVIIFIVFFMALALSVKYARNMKALASKSARFARQMTIKSLELNHEKKRTELLLYQMLPKSVANRLRKGKAVKPQYFDSVTIYFSDIVGFTEICSRSTPMEVVAMLNNIYSSFDASIDRYDVYKVETIGDAYMVASGLPKPNQNHARDICLMALEIRKSLSDVRMPHEPNETFVQRVGIHTGSCVAGVVGLKMPRYCLFGDTVNTASRIETSGEGNKVHISCAVKNQLDLVPGFHIVDRGDTNIKGKGLMKTYWLLDHTESL